MDYKDELENRMKDKVRGYVGKGVKVLVFTLFIIALTFLIGYVVMLLWNWLMPDVFGLTTITYWQAFGILVLAKIIFGFGGGNGPGKSHKKAKMKSRNNKSCNGIRRDFSEWKYYDEFWSSEGESAFKAFVAKKQDHHEEQ